MANEIKIAASTSDPEVIRNLAASESPSVRLAIAENPSTPDDVLVQLSRSNDMDVRLAASKRLPADQRGGGNVDWESLPLADRTPKIFMSTTAHNPDVRVRQTVGLVYGSSSKIAWGFSKQSDRLTAAMNAALLDLEQNALARRANAVVGITFAANSSVGSSATLLGSSEGIIVVGTAIILES